MTPNMIINGDQTVIILNNNKTIVKTKKERDFCGPFYCFPERLQGSNLPAKGAHVAGDPGYCCWKHWSVRNII